MLIKLFFTPIHRSYILLFFSIGIIAGSIFISVFPTTIFASPVWLFLALALLILALATSRKASVVLAIAAGVLIICYRVAPDFISQDYIEEIISREVEIIGTVSKDPDESSGKYNLNLTELSLVSNDEQISLAGHLFTQVSEKNIQRSDRVKIKGELSEGFGSYAVSIYRPEIKGIERPEPGDIFLKVRNSFAEKIKLYIPPPQNGLALGYLLGQKSGVDEGIKDTLQTIGLTHIIVASGAHLSTLTGFARRLLGRVSRFASLLAALCSTFLFIGITGLSASMLRAGLVTIISLVLWYVGRKMHPLRLIILVASITLIYNPFYVTDLAWLLSFLSFTGILVLGPAITEFLYGKDRKVGFVASTLVTSFAAALLCIPVLLYFFGQISLISLFANLLILPTVSIVMGLTFLTGLSASVLPMLGPVFGRITQFILDYQISVANFFGEQKSFLVAIEPNNALVLMLYIPVIVVIFTTFMFRKRKAKRSCLQEKLPLC